MKIFGLEIGIAKQTSEPPEPMTPEMGMLEVGSTGLNYQGGRILEEFLPQLSGGKASKIYREMSENDAIIGAFVFLIDMLVRQVNWTVSPASEDSQDVEAAEFLKSCMDDISGKWGDVISEALTMVVYGWSLTEIVYKERIGPDELDPTKRSKYTDGRIGWRKFGPRSQDTLYEWQFDHEGGVRALVQQAPPDYLIRVIPIEKALLFRTTTRKNNPEGRSMLRNAYRSWHFKKRIEEVEGIGIERDLAGYPVFWVPRKWLSTAASPEERQTVEALKYIATNIRRDKLEGAVLPREYNENGNETVSFQLLSTGGRRQFDTTDIINRYDKRIAMTVLADFLMLGQDAVGTYALSQDKTSIFTLALRTVLGEIQDVINRYGVTRLFKLNDFAVETLPMIKHGPIADIDIATIVDMLDKLTRAGASIFPDEELENHLRRKMGLPQRTDGGA